MQHPRAYSFLHVPVQSGSDEILGLMKREYSREDFCHVVDFLRSKVRVLLMVENCPRAHHSFPLGAGDYHCHGYHLRLSDRDGRRLSRHTEIVPKVPLSIVVHQSGWEDWTVVNGFGIILILFRNSSSRGLARPQREWSAWIRSWWAFVLGRRPCLVFSCLFGIAQVKERTKILSDFFRSYGPYGHKVGCLEEKIIASSANILLHTLFPKVGRTETVLVTEEATDGVNLVAHNKSFDQVRS